METECPRCRCSNRNVARFCARCGLSLAVGVNGTRGAGRVPHPNRAEVPEGFVPIGDSADLYYRAESSLGGATLIGTEGLNVSVFNAGYPLRDVELHVRGDRENGRELFSVVHTIAELERAQEVSFEIPSYELSAPLETLVVTLMSAEFGQEA